jgi:hypothetical protein
MWLVILLCDTNTSDSVKILPIFLPGLLLIHAKFKCSLKFHHHKKAIRQWQITNGAFQCLQPLKVAAVDVPSIYKLEVHFTYLIALVIPLVEYSQVRYWPEYHCWGCLEFSKLYCRKGCKFDKHKCGQFLVE